MSCRYAIMLVGSLLALGGCQAEEASRTASRIVPEAVEVKFVESGCPPDRCAEVVVNALRFPDSPALSERLRQTLLSMSTGFTDGSDEPSTDSWEAFAQAFFAQAKDARQFGPLHSASQATLEAQIYAQHDDLLVVELDSFVYHAGQAHGMPLTEFMVIDERLGRVVTLEEMLIEGREEAFREVLARAHRRWLEQIDADEDFRANWPFSESRNVAPLEMGWTVRYDVYEIAPYALGQPELHIANDELMGIVKPRYLGLTTD
ncbi:RsiV family protein [Billgrantia saliphila]|uniref:RsiV family protein n=1 Tax=Billgrantia saliphila TaxID=1848458 RepID=UPI000CE40067|nr:RsiV family protein [Halomonas saliphila]